MIELDWEKLSYVIAIVLGFSAILSPAITAAENNKHQIRMKHIRDFEKNRTLAIQNYLNSVSLLIKDKNADTILNYYSALANLYLFIPKSQCIFLEQIDVKIRHPEHPLTYESYKSVLNWANELGEINIQAYLSELPVQSK